MIPTMKRIGLLMMTLTAAPASAQLIAAKTHTIAMGHHHVMVDDMEKNMSFWKSLGGETVTFYDSIGIRFPNVLIFFREQKPTARTNGAVVNHVGLQFKDLRPLVKQLRSAGTPIITSEVVAMAVSRAPTCRRSRLVDRSTICVHPSWTLTKMSTKSIGRPPWPSRTEAQ